MRPTNHFQSERGSIHFILPHVFGCLLRAHVSPDEALQPCSLLMEEEIELQYSPSRWVVRTTADRVVQEHIETVTAASKRARDAVPHQINLEYGNGEGQHFDIYGTDLPEDSPVLVYIHGGYWQALSKDVSAYPAIPLWQAGIRTVVVDYNLAPNVNLNVIVEEIRAMAIHILKMAKDKDCKCVWFSGHSAGAHLVASLLDNDWFNSLDPGLSQRIQGVVLISGIFDVSPLIHTSENINLQLTLKDAILVSPLFKLGAINICGKITALLAIAEHDSPAFHGQSAAYSKVLKKKKIQTNLIEIKDMDHFTVVENLECPSFTLTQAIISLIKTGF